MRKKLPFKTPTEPVVHCMIDSGAFSAFKLGKPVALDAYCAYVDANRDWIGSYVNMDHIDPKATEDSARISFENFLEMRKRGLDPLPVFHAGEDITYLYRILDLGCTRICLAASAMNIRGKVDDWYASVWEHLVGSDGYPIVKVHALGEGRVSPLTRFPWRSSDSTTWLYKAQRTGLLPMPGDRFLSMRKDNYTSRSAPDIDMLNEVDNAELTALLAKARLPRECLTEHRGTRTGKILHTYLACIYAMDIERRARKGLPRKFRNQGLFQTRDIQRAYGQDDRPREQLKINAFDLHLVVGGDTSCFAAIAETGHKAILASYFYVRSGGYYRWLKDYCIDPVKTCREIEVYADTYNVLQEHLI